MVKTFGEESRLEFNTSHFVAQLKDDHVLVEYQRSFFPKVSFMSMVTLKLSFVSELNATMISKYHHSQLHSSVLSIELKKAMTSALEGSIASRNPFYIQLASLIGLSHDIVQDGAINSEFLIACKLKDALDRNPEFSELNSKAKDAVYRLAFHSIISFTTLDFPALRSFGEIEVDRAGLDGDEDTKPSLLVDFGQKVSFLDLFSKITYLSDPTIFELFMTDSCRLADQGLNDADLKSIILISQMIQMGQELSKPQSQRVYRALSRWKESDPTDLLKEQVLAIVRSDSCIDSIPFYARLGVFWREGMYPNTNMKRLLGIKPEIKLVSFLMETLEKPNVVKMLLVFLKGMERNKRIGDVRLK